MGIKDPVPTFSYLVEQIVRKHPHLIEARVFGDHDESNGSANEQHPYGASGDEAVHDSNEFMRKIWGDRPYVSAGGYSNSVEKAVELVDQSDNVPAAFGRAFIANVRLSLPLSSSSPSI